MEELIFTEYPIIKIATTTFINTPVILRFEELNLIEIVPNLLLPGYATKIPIFHPDGTQLATAINSRIFPTKEGEKAGITIEKYKSVCVCKMNNKELFEIRQQGDNLFRTTAELYTNDGFFIKCMDNPHVQIISNGEDLTIGGLTMRNVKFNGRPVGIHLDRNGSFCMGGYIPK